MILKINFFERKTQLIPAFLFLFGGFRFPPFFMFADGVGLLLLMSWFRNRIWMVVNDFNSLFNQRFNNFNIPIFIRRAEGKGNTRFSCPTSSTYSVYICFRNVWNVKINNGIYIDNVNSTRSDICSD